jgi:hypothetical protein
MKASIQKQNQAEKIGKYRSYREIGFYIIEYSKRDKYQAQSYRAIFYNFFFLVQKNHPTDIILT